MKRIYITKIRLLNGLVAGLAALLTAGVSEIALAAAPPLVSISNIPLSVIVPARPQVIFAIGNSNSMDSSDNITDDSNKNIVAPNAVSSSAIMTWSGNVGNASLYPASTPVNYTVPSGFTSPITAVAGNGVLTTSYTALVQTQTVPTGNNWSCAHFDATAPWLLTNPGSLATFPPAGWNPNLQWWYNGSFLQQTTAPASAALDKMPNARQRFHSEGEELAWVSRLFDVGMSNGGGITPIPESTGKGPPACGPGSIPFVACPPPTYCDLWKWNIPGTKPVNYYGDNSASRLNISKAAITNVIQNFAHTTDFGLMDFYVTGVVQYDSWLYYISPASGFTTASFSNSQASPPAGTRYVDNPCYNATGGTLTSCNSLANQISAGFAGNTSPHIGFFKYMAVATTSDDPFINDVFIANNPFSGNSTYLAYSGPVPATAYPPNFSLAQYNTGAVSLTYNFTKPAIGGGNGVIYTSPTNAGYVAGSPHVFFAKRGNLWNGNVSAAGDSRSLLQPVISIGTSNPTSAQITAYINANFAPFLMEENDDPNAGYTQAIQSSAGQSALPGMIATAISTFSGMSHTTGAGCTIPQYLILLTDGEPTLDLAGKNWPPLGSAAATGYGVTASFNGDGSLNTTNDQALTDTINNLTTLATTYGVKTYVVGLGPGVSPSLNPQAAAALTAMAVAGGTKSYIAATSPAAVVTALNTILATINSINQAGAGAAANSGTLTTTSVVYQSQFTPESSPYSDWTGDLLAFPINPVTFQVSATANWSAQQQLQGLSGGLGGNTWWSTGRIIATWNPTSGRGVPFEWANISATQQTQLQSAIDPVGTLTLDYIRGDVSHEIRNGGSFRPRSALLGDIVDSGALYIGAPAGPYIGDATYQAFETAQAARTPLLYAGANDGMLHAFNAATGNEQFAFIPNGVFPNLEKLAQPNYNSNHLFFVDGTPTANDVKFNTACLGTGACWHTLLVGGLNDGGSSIYALDVTNPSTLTSEAALASAVLWEFTDANLGFTYSKPVLAQTHVTLGGMPNGFMAFFGNGYNNGSSIDPYFYAVDAQTGVQMSKIDLCTSVVPNPCNYANPNGLSSMTVVNSGGSLTQPVDTVYAGDLQGNLWKINIVSPTPASWKVTLLFQAQDAFNNPQPITVTPAVSLHPLFPADTGLVVYFGTGQFLGTPDLATTQIGSFYGVWDDGVSPPYKRVNLTQQTLSNTTIGTIAVRTITNNPVNWTTSKGWFFDLLNLGERVITNPVLFNGEVVFTTYTPPAALCMGGGTAFLMAVNYLNGGSFPTPQLDINGDGQLNSNDQTSTGLNPVGLSLGNVFASGATVFSTGGTTIGAVKVITKSGGVGQSGITFQTIAEAGGLPGRISWWQIQ